MVARPAPRPPPAGQDAGALKSVGGRRNPLYGFPDIRCSRDGISMTTALRERAGRKSAMPTHAVDERRRRLVACFDGTWNTAQSYTNVSRLYAALADGATGCDDQLKFYEEGVGTSWGQKLRGGAFGLGLDLNILRGYCWLAGNYRASPTGGTVADPRDPQQERFEDGDEIFLFGFSRGAYTARSLAGLINRCGLPKPSGSSPLTPSSPVVKEAWALYRRRFARKPGDQAEARREAACRSFREANCWNVKVRFIGVWDTVGALGIPMFRNGVFPFFRGRNPFHDTDLGRVIEHARHAMAIDEHREDYRVTLWTARHPVGTQSVEQRWFPGAHANVGGGYEGDHLCNPPLLWLASEAARLGLEFTHALHAGRALRCKAQTPPSMQLKGDEYLSPVRDSFAEFMFGGYMLLKGYMPYYRPMLSEGIEESIDETARLKSARDPAYRPRNLAHAGEEAPAAWDGAPVEGGEAHADR
jgi:uncharacterized protein (DUF2235 family)